MDINRMRLSEIKEGDVLIADGGFTCLEEGQECKVVRLPNGYLAVACADGWLHLDGQRDGNGNLVGFSRAPSHSEATHRGERKGMKTFEEFLRDALADPDAILSLRAVRETVGMFVGMPAATVVGIIATVHRSDSGEITRFGVCGNQVFESSGEGWLPPKTDEASEPRPTAPRASTPDRLKVGDIVRLNSGSGPWMTVERRRADGLVRCVWFVDALVHRDSFDSVSLIQATAKDRFGADALKRQEEAPQEAQPAEEQGGDRPGVAEQQEFLAGGAAP